MRAIHLIRPLTVLCLSACAFGQQVRLDSWSFLPDKAGALTIETLNSAKGWRPARAGLSWNAQFSDLRDYGGVAWYRTSFEVPQFAQSHRVLLRFGAVDYLAEVFVNGRRLASHEGGYTPFVVDATGTAHPGGNELVIRVLDPPNKGETAGIRYDEIPHGKQNWYVQTSGLWQPVVLEFRPQIYIEQVRVTAAVLGSVSVEVTLAGVQASAGATRVSLTVRDPTGAEVFRAVRDVTGPAPCAFSGTVPTPQLWSPDHPALYTAEAKIEGGVADSQQTRFGFRNIEARDGHLFLNGELFYMIGALDQDFYPDTIYTPPSAEYVRREMQKAKDLGLNTLRCHIKVCEPEYLDAADEAGIVVWYEIPNWDHFSPASSARGERTLEAMVARDWNHPSILVQSIVNESWGIDLKQADQRHWLLGLYDRARALTAPLGRLIVDNSPCCENFHLRTDLNDFHQYYSIPDNAARWDQWVADFASRPRWALSPYGDAASTGGEPLIVSEFGNWGLPQLPAELPWWLSREVETEITRPAGVLDRFREYRFDRIFPDYGAAARATEWHQFASLKHEIEQMRQYASIQGYIITEFTDINWESNGLLDMWRNPKVYAPELRRIQQPDVVLATLPTHNYRAGGEVRANVQLSHFSTHDLAGGHVFWNAVSGAAGQIDVPSVGTGSVVNLGHIVFPARATEASTVTIDQLFLTLRDRDGAVIAENRYDLFVFPEPKPASKTAISVLASSSLADALSKNGYTLASQPQSGRVLVASRFDQRAEDFVRNGGRALLLLDSKDALPAGPAVKLEDRKGDFDGNWVSNFAWVLPEAAPFRGISVSPILGWEAAAVTPRFVLRGVAAANYDDVLAGMFYGWLNNNSPLLVRARIGRGVVLLTTFRFDQYGGDPFATALLDALITYAAEPNLAPRLELRP